MIRGTNYLIISIASLSLAAGAAVGCGTPTLHATTTRAASALLTRTSVAGATLRVAHASYAYCTDDRRAEKRIELDLVASSPRGGRLYLDDIQIVRRGAPLARSQGLACEARRSGHSPQILDGRLGWTLVAGDETSLSLVCWPQLSKAHPSAGAFAADLELSVELAGVVRRVTHRVRARFDAPYIDRAGRRACRLKPQPSLRIAGN